MHRHVERSRDMAVLSFLQLASLFNKSKSPAIKACFFFNDHLFSCFSLAIASFMLLNDS